MTNEFHFFYYYGNFGAVGRATAARHFFPRVPKGWRHKKNLWALYNPLEGKNNGKETIVTATVTEVQGVCEVMRLTHLYGVILFNSHLFSSLSIFLSSTLTFFLHPSPPFLCFATPWYALSLACSVLSTERIVHSQSRLPLLMANFAEKLCRVLRPCKISQYVIQFFENLTVNFKVFNKMNRTFECFLECCEGGHVRIWQSEAVGTDTSENQHPPPLYEK